MPRGCQSSASPLQTLKTSLSPTAPLSTACLGIDPLLSLHLGTEHLPRWTWQGRILSEEICPDSGRRGFNTSLPFVILLCVEGVPAGEHGNVASQWSPMPACHSTFSVLDNRHLGRAERKLYLSSLDTLRGQSERSHEINILNFFQLTP